MSIHNGNLTIAAANAERYRDLTEVSGSLYIHANAKLDALQSVGWFLYISADAKLDAPELYPPGFSKFRVIDGLPCVVLSEKTRDGVTILSCRAAMVKDQKLVGDRFYIAQRGENNAHGKTISEAMQELAFKTAKRDLTQYRAMPLDTSKTPKQWALVYRDITGACKLGAEMFMKERGKLKRRYTLAEIIEETKGAYGSEKFQEAVR